MGKLVRDRIPEIITKNGEVPITRVLDNDEFVIELSKKLEEEILEYNLAKNFAEKIQELADIQELVLAALKIYAVSPEQFNEFRLSKRQKNGGFENRIFLERVE